MGQTRLTIACVVNDRTRPILDGRVPVPGFDLVPIHADPQDIFRRALQEGAFDVTELSMGSHITTTARGDNKYLGIPAFLSRSFRHSSIYIRTDRGIAGAADLRGKRIGIADYQQTAVLWVRGILSDQYGVAPGDVAWRTGGLEKAGAPQRLALKLPPHLDLRPIGPSDSLNSLLAAGELDAIISPRPPSCFTAGSAPVARLFPNYRDAEVAYFKESGFFPIMHVLAVRKDVADAHPELPVALFQAFAQAKRLAYADLAEQGVLSVALPWIVSELAQTQAIMGPDPWPYGFRENERELAAMARYAHADGLAERRVEPAELFHPATLERAMKEKGRP